MLSYLTNSHQARVVKLGYSQDVDLHAGNHGQISSQQTHQSVFLQPIMKRKDMSLVSCSEVKSPIQRGALTVIKQLSDSLTPTETCTLEKAEKRKAIDFLESESQREKPLNILTHLNTDTDEIRASKSHPLGLQTEKDWLTTRKTGDSGKRKKQDKSTAQAILITNNHSKHMCKPTYLERLWELGPMTCPPQHIFRNQTIEQFLKSKSHMNHMKTLKQSENHQTKEKSPTAKPQTMRPRTPRSRLGECVYAWYVCILTENTAREDRTTPFRKLEGRSSVSAELEGSEARTARPVAVSK
ncbi:lipoyl synthase [Striga asiatica]|uniref:Lipoyl synthase n=1 Tax=Striga asiatica TaxID=4170 RepID=A0A5A7QQA2_STRAF|nr:lipoyl synthase [Striga asiatica]